MLNRSEHGTRRWMAPGKTGFHPVHEDCDAAIGHAAPHPAFGHPLPIGWGEGWGEGLFPLLPTGFRRSNTRPPQP